MEFSLALPMEFIIALRPKDSATAALILAFLKLFKELE